MFNKLIMLWKGEAPLAKQYEEFVEMLNLSRTLFHKIVDSLKAGEAINDLENVVYQSDIKINKAERRIRKELVTHLSINPGQEIASCLILMSIVKDAERLGDFCKNLYEASSHWCQSCSNLHFKDQISEFINYVSEVYDKTIKAFQHEDEVLAAEIIQDEVKWNKRFDHFIGQIGDSEITAREAVCTVLMVRSLKRLQAHLSNIASSVVLPIHQIDHRPKHLRNQ